jgi:peptide deformylase
LTESSPETIEGSGVLPLGDPRLRVPSPAVADFGSPELERDREALVAELERFRRRFGFGRAIAAPQLGIPRRMIAMNLGDGTKVLVNPVMTWTSDETLTMWDDCMSFPSLLVRVRRHLSISVSFQDERGGVDGLVRLPVATSELLQHEIDHLDGILAIDRRLEGESIILRTAYDANPAYFRDQVDYAIGE